MKKKNIFVLCFAFCILTIPEILDITFDDDAFEQLVMDPIKKELISSLVKSDHKGLDIISGKGGGCIFLLHGPLEVCKFKLLCSYKMIT